MRTAFKWAFVLAPPTILLVASLVFLGWGLPAVRDLSYMPSRLTEPFAEYLASAKYDPVLGWKTGRRSDAMPGAPCASVFGDSFTYSANVDDAEAWPAVLSQIMGCRVGNYGVPGYGSDQAFLRFKQMEPRGEVVLLNHLSENIIRNVNQFRNLISPVHQWQLKPRFLAGGDLVPLVADAGVRLHPERYLHHEFFLPAWVPALSPYVLAHAEAKALGEPLHAQFYRPDHPSRGLDVTFTVLRGFVREAEARGQKPVVTIIPTCRDLTLGRAYGPLVEKIKAAGWRFIDFGAEIAKRTSEPERLFGSCSAHPNAAGYRMLAEIAAEHLRRPSAVSLDGAVKRP